MNWIAILKLAGPAALNAALAALVQHFTGDPALAVGAVAAGTAVAHGLPSPISRK
jgi:hypothetical protein